MTDTNITGGLRMILNRETDEVDVTDSHILAGYKPLLIGLPLQDQDMVGWLARNSVIRLSIRATSPRHREVAWLELKRTGSWRMGDTTLVIYEGLRGDHQFLNVFYRATNSIHELMRSHKAGDASLPAALYTQVRIAYSIPRKISLMCLGDGERFNVFPTDLHGSVGKGFYAGSLRIGSLVCRQVEEYKKVMLADMDIFSYLETYSLGKNHMKEPQPVQPPFNQSDRWGLPVPKQATACKELLWKDSWDSGIHRVHFYEVVSEKVLDVKVPRLCHIHRYYAQWRINQKLEAVYFLR